MPPRSCVLIVDDDEGMCETLSDIISEKGFRVVMAESGAKAIEEVSAQPFDFVLIDIMMPGLNGIQTLRKLKTVDPYVTAIVMMGHDAMEGLIYEALRAGAQGVLYKPFEIETVLDILERKGNDGSAMPRIDLKGYKLQPEALRLIAEEMAREDGVVPLRVEDGVLSIALSNPRNLGAIGRIRRVTAGLDIDAFQASTNDVLSAIERGYSSLRESPPLATAQSTSAGITQREMAGAGGQADGDEESREEPSRIAALEMDAPGSDSAKAGRVVPLQSSASPQPTVLSHFPDSDETEPVGMTLTGRESRQLEAARREMSKAGAVKKRPEVAAIVEDVQGAIETSAAQSDSEEAASEDPGAQEKATTSAQVDELSDEWPGARKGVVRSKGSVDVVDVEPPVNAHKGLGYGGSSGSAESVDVEPADPANQEPAPPHIGMVKLDEDQPEVVEVASPTADSAESLGETEIGAIAVPEETSRYGSAEEKPTGRKRQVLEHVLESGSLDVIEDTRDTGNGADVHMGDDSIPAMLDSLLALAVRDGSSDIHIEPQQDYLRVRCRINGVLHNVKSVPLSTHPLLVSCIKALSNLSIAERHCPQAGQMSISVDGKEMDFRVATSNTAWGEMVVLRVQEKDRPITDLSEMGFLPECLARYRHLLESSGGLILVSGPVGSGRTATLYASIHQFDHDEHNVITIEDPVEYRFDGINQMELNCSTNTSMASGLRTSMRLDPDVIMVGDIRDKETAKAVVRAALTGHLILAAIQANDAVDTLFRLVDVGIEPFLITSALEGVVAQRLARRVCPRCQVLRDAPDEERVAYEWEMGEKREKFVCGEGCDYCAHTGYKGRIGIQEVLVMSEVIRHMLITGAGADKIQAQAMREGLVSMRRDGMVKVNLGMTTPREVLRSMSGLEHRKAKFRRFCVKQLGGTDAS